MTGGTARFELLYRANAAPVLAYLRRRTGDQEAVFDLAAEVFTVAWRRLPEVPEPALPWLLGVARRVLANHHRSTHRRLALMRRLAQEPPRAVEALPVADGRVRGALQQLSEADREVVLLVGWDGLAPAEAAVVLGLHPATARTRLHRARQRLQAALEAQKGCA